MAAVAERFSLAALFLASSALANANNLTAWRFVPAGSSRRLTNDVKLMGFGDQGLCVTLYDDNTIQDDTVHSNPQNWLQAHNHVRECHGVPPLEWAPELLPYAKAWVHTILQRCETGDDLKNWVLAGGAGTSRPHDPEAYVSEKPLQAENIDARMFNSINDPEWRPVQDWYREVEDCPGAGQEPGCGGDLNHYTALIWREAKRLACYAGIRGDFRVVSCRYAAAGDGDGCEVPNSVGPPNSTGCQLGAGTENGLPEVPALKKTCPRLGAPSPPPGASQNPGPVAIPEESTSAEPPNVNAAENKPRPLPWVTKIANLSCIRKKELGACERCLHDEQCHDGFYCCPFMKKCVKDGGMTCWTPIAFCQPPCMDSKPVNECKCNPKGSKDTFPAGWQRPTCAEGQEPVIVTTTPRPVAPPMVLTYSGFKSQEQWDRFQKYVKSQLESWKVDRDCFKLKAIGVSSSDQEHWQSSTGRVLLTFSEFGDVMKKTETFYEFEGLVPTFGSAGLDESWIKAFCTGQTPSGAAAAQEWGMFPQGPALTWSAQRAPAVAAAAAGARFSLLLLVAGLVWRRRSSSYQDSEQLLETYDFSE
eukprot:TRINITY_DN36995_c0_g1_i1.p1 TRINITY_DN36995_c0_g1~~TRINITY_DN36995_c0_g1_i1.p1  ORF type:complete len:623 (-),score=101.54 TRINITY_DN36995_c0_g1_i1:7-1770(-)